ncbi:MAG: mitochondrial fission ELM1 family protein [Maricaulaceae bacterium]
MASAPLLAWIISDGRRGIENQALGLAEALARLTPLNITRKSIGSDPTFAAIPPRLQFLRKPKPIKYGLAAPFPNIAIGCGRQAIAPLRVIKAQNPKTFIVYVQDPRGSYGLFDLIIAPQHDGLKRPNAISMIGSPNRITEQKLQDAKHAFKSKLSNYKSPRAAMLIGGRSRTQFIDECHLRQHITTAYNLMKANYSLFITLSRRTDDVSRKAWTKLSNDHSDKIWFYDEETMGAERNPYFAFLAASDIIFVTQDSTNMLTEAYATTAPVYRLNMAGQVGKFLKLYDALDEFRDTPPLDATLNSAKISYEPLRETDRIAASMLDSYSQF